MTHFTAWFFSLSLGQAMFFVALIGIIFISGAYGYLCAFRDLIAYLYKNEMLPEWLDFLIAQKEYDHRQLVLDKADEFEYTDGPSQEYSDRDKTCYTCEDQRVCAFAFDGYNTKGDCLAIK